MWSGHSCTAAIEPANNQAHIEAIRTSNLYGSQELLNLYLSIPSFQTNLRKGGRLRMVTILAPQFGREVLRCNHCDLVQFATPKKFCRRCRQPYDCDPSYEAEQADNSRTLEAFPRTDSVRDRIAFNVLKLRQMRGLTQKEIGLRMGVPRTYVSKIEGRKVTPTLSSLDRLARVLGTSVVGLVSAPEDREEEYPSEFRRDPFLLQVSRFAARLTPAQRTRVLDCARRLVDERNQKDPVRTIPSCEEEVCFSTQCCSTSSPDAALKISTRF
jgi:transcriptional regulator with XRE-family HTH domain